MSDERKVLTCPKHGTEYAEKVEGVTIGECAWCLVEEREELRRWVDDLQGGMFINCVYCGHRYGPKDEVPSSMADVLKEHIENCPKHPMSALKKHLEEVSEIRVRLAHQTLEDHDTIVNLKAEIERLKSPQTENTFPTVVLVAQRHDDLVEAERNLQGLREAILEKVKHHLSVPVVCVLAGNIKRLVEESPPPAPWLIRFDGPPAAESGRFVEVEDLQGHGLSKGRWEELEDGDWALIID